MLNANPQDDRAALAQEAADFKMDFPILKDEDQLVAEALNISRTAEAMLIDPKTWKIVYRGSVNDKLDYEAEKPEAANNYLADALDEFLAGKPISNDIVKGPGCLVSLPNKDIVEENPPVFTTDVAPILQQKCQKCHRNGGIGSWPMLRYEVVKGWAPMMREVIRTRRMPPWQADPHVGTFANDLSLTDEERQTIVHWVEAGAPRGEGEDPLLENPLAEVDWQLGTPDEIIKIDTQHVPATGVLDYKYFETELDVKEDKWVRAIEVLPGNRAVLHHLLVSLTYPDGHKAPMERRSRWLDGIFAAYAPGAEPEVFPEGSGRFIPKGTKLLFQLHYTTTGREEKDATQLGIFFADEPREKEYMVIGPFNTRIKIPPHAKAYEAQAKQTFEEPFTLYSLFPHMHFRGKSMKYTAIYPDGKEEVILNVPNYNFNWQRNYVLTEPMKFPGGTQIVVDAVYDNSSQNAFNPAPDSTVHWGDQSFDEMLIGYMSFVRQTQQVASR